VALKPTVPRQLLDLFQPFGIAPSPMHEAIQNAAIEAGWVPPWEVEEQARQKKWAGKRSGISRRGLRDIRQFLVYYAFGQLDLKKQRKPYSNASLEALRSKYDYFLGKSPDDPDPILSGILSALTPADGKALKKASDDTLLADLKAIRQRNRALAQRFG
jgi:hypothetical protein